MRDLIIETLNTFLSNLEPSNDEDLKLELEDLLQSVAAVIGHLKVEVYPPGTTLCVEGAEEDKFYVIAKGGVAIYKQLGTNSTKDLLAEKGPGDFFGEMALVLNAPRSADVITTQESIMLELDRRSFRKATRISNRLGDFMSQRTIDQLDENWHKEQDKRGQKLPVAFRIFTSYSRRDEDFVLQLVQDLQTKLIDNNVSLWIDQLQIRPGDEWDKMVEDALETSDAMMLILSPNSTESDNVRDEWSYYRDEGKPIVPILKEKCKVPFRVRRYQYVNFHQEVYTNALAQAHARILELADGRNED